MIRTHFDSVKQYMLSVLETPVMFWRPPARGVWVHSKGLPEGQSIVSVVVDRRGQFQTELFTAGLTAQTADSHTHPGVDSYELFLAGDLTFNLDSEPAVRNAGDGSLVGTRLFVEVPADAPHSATVHDGAAFFSFQHWKEKAPTTIGHEFELTNKGEKNG